MKNKKVKIFIGIILVILFVFLSNSCIADTIIGNPEDFDPSVGGSTDPTLGGKIEPILGIIQIVGIVLSVISIMVIGIKYIIGSASEKADYKTTMIPYLIGTIILFASTQLLKVIYDIAQNFN